MIGALITIPDHTKNSFQYHGRRIVISCANHTSEYLSNDLTDYLTSYYYLTFTACSVRATQDSGDFGKFDPNRQIQLSSQSLTLCAIQRPYYSISKHHPPLLVRYNRPTQARGTYLVHQTQRLHSTAVHHVISTTTRFEATTNLFFIHYLPSSRLAAPSTTTISRSTPIL